MPRTAHRPPRQRIGLLTHPRSSSAAAALALAVPRRRRRGGAATQPAVRRSPRRGVPHHPVGRRARPVERATEDRSRQRLLATSTGASSAADPCAPRGRARPAMRVLLRRSPSSRASGPRTSGPRRPAPTATRAPAPGVRLDLRRPPAPVRTVQPRSRASRPAPGGPRSASPRDGARRRRWSPGWSAVHSRTPAPRPHRPPTTRSAHSPSRPLPVDPARASRSCRCGWAAASPWACRRPT